MYGLALEKAMSNAGHTQSVKMPRYQSHKQVHAFKIVRIESVEADGAAHIVPADASVRMSGSSLVTAAGWFDRYKGGDDDPGYFVLYADGYQSWSPTKAFEEGYYRIKD